MRSAKRTTGTSFILSWAAKAALSLMVLSVMVTISQARNSEPVQAQLVPEVQAIQPGKTFFVGLLLKMDEGWHTYWKNPGDSGLATRITWNLPEGFRADDIQWPYPQKFETPTEMTFGYKGKILLITDIHVPEETKPGMIVKISARVDWLACMEECIPGHAEVAFEIAVKKENPRIETKWAGLFEKTRVNLPTRLSGWKVKAFAEKNRILINLSTLSRDEDKLDNIYFFSEQIGLVDYAANQKQKKMNSEYVLEIQRSKYSAQLPSRLIGVLFSKDGWNVSRNVSAMHINVPLKTLD